MELYTSIASHRRNIPEEKSMQQTDFVTGQNLNNKKIRVEDEHEFSKKNYQRSEQVHIQNKKAMENSHKLTTNDCKRFSNSRHNEIIQVSKAVNSSPSLYIAASLIAKNAVKDHKESLEDNSTSHVVYSHGFNGKLSWHTRPLNKDSDSFSGQQKQVANKQNSIENMHSHYRYTTMHDFVQNKSNKEIFLNRQEAGCKSCETLTEEIIKARRKLEELERLNSDKEYEAIQLRDSLERNEKAIIKAFQTVKSNNNLKASLIHKNFDSCLKAHMNNPIRNDDTLRNQIAILTKEVEQLKEHVVVLRLQREEFATRCGRTEWQLAKSRDRERELCRVINKWKSDTIHYSDSMNSPWCYFPERQWKSEDNMKSFDCIDSDLEPLLNFEMSNDLCKIQKSKDAMSDTILLLKDQLLKTKEELDRNKTEFEIEQNRWEEEKTKVLNYQRFLQMQYLQLMNKKRDAKECNMEDGRFDHKLSVILEEGSL